MNIDDKLNRIEDKIDKIEAQLGIHSDILGKQETNLRLHMYRTDLAEKRLEHIENTIIPITKHVNQMSGVLKAIGVLGIIVSILIGIKTLIG